MRVVGGSRNASVKGQVFFDPVVALRHGLLEAIERFAHVLGLVGINSLSGQCADLAFEDSAHLDNLQHGVHGLKHRRIKSEGAGAVRRCDEDP
jgi:hypothetical protein